MINRLNKIKILLRQNLVQHDLWLHVKDCRNFSKFLGVCSPGSEALLFPRGKLFYGPSLSLDCLWTVSELAKNCHWTVSGLSLDCL